MGNDAFIPLRSSSVSELIPGDPYITVVQSNGQWEILLELSDKWNFDIITGVVDLEVNFMLFFFSSLLSSWNMYM